MLHDYEEEARMKRILAVLDKNLRLALQIDEVVGRLSEKRVTLEEKMIRAYFHRVAANMLEIAANINRSLAGATTPKTNNGTNTNQAASDTSGSPLDTAAIAERCDQLDLFLDRLQKTVDELLKVLRYDLNFVEQYFEFNFYGKLTNEDGYLPDSEKLLTALK